MQREAQRTALGPGEGKLVQLGGPIDDQRHSHVLAARLTDRVVAGDRVEQRARVDARSPRPVARPPGLVA